MKVGTILVAEYIPGADKLLRLEVDFGPKLSLGKTDVLENDLALQPLPEKAPGEDRDIRQILSGIRQYYQPEDLVGKQCPFITNLEPRVMRGLESHGMILAVGGADGSAILLHPDKLVPPGSKLR